MTQEHKQLLLKDLSARLPYGVKVWRQGACYVISDINIEKQRVYLKVDFEALRGWWWDIEEVKLCLRSMSSMTEEEREELLKIIEHSLQLKEDFDAHQNHFYGIRMLSGYSASSSPQWDSYGIDAIDWLNEHHFDYRGLIEKGLALEITEITMPDVLESSDWLNDDGVRNV